MIYLDNAATTKIDARVLEEMMPYLTENYGNAGSVYELGRQSAKAISKARERVANLIGAEPDQIIFTSGGSEANNLVLKGTRKALSNQRNSHIITTKIEHDSILNSLRDMSGEYILIDPGEDGEVTVEAVDDVLSSIPRARGLVSVMHTNNETGVKNDVKKIAEYCRFYGTLFHTDCVQALGSGEINVKDIGCDFMSMSAHKVFAPKGVGALYVRDKSLLTPLISGGNAQEFGLRGGTENVAGIVGFGKACELISKDDGEKAAKTCATFLEFLKRYLNERHILSCLSLHGYREGSRVVNAAFKNADGETLLMMLSAKGVCVSAGSACTSHESKPSHVLTAMGVDAEEARNSIRVSFSKNNTPSEAIDAALIVAKAVNNLLALQNNSRRYDV